MDEISPHFLHDVRNGVVVTDLTTFICITHIVDRPPIMVMILAGYYCAHMSRLTPKVNGDGCITTTTLYLIEKI